MTHAVSCRLLTAVAWVRSWTSPFEVCGCQIGTEAVLRCQCHSTNATYSFSSTGRSYQKDKQPKPGNLPKSSVLLEIGDHWVEKDCNFSFFKELNYPSGDGSRRSEEKYELVFCPSEGRTGHFSNISSKRQ
jgi:hypothetical protein